MLLHESAATMEQSMPENLSTHACGECEVNAPLTDCRGLGESDPEVPSKGSTVSTSPPKGSAISSAPPATSNTKVKLSFSVDRLLSCEPGEPHRNTSSSPSAKSCCEGGVFSCCSFPHCFSQAGGETRKFGHAPNPVPAAPTSTAPYPFVGLDKLYPSLYMDYKSVLRPTPIRAADHAAPTYPTLATNALLRFHHHQKQQHQQHHAKQLHQQHKPPQHNSTTASGLLAPLHSLSTLHLNQQQRFLGKTPQQLLDIAPTTPAAATLQNGGHPQKASGGAPSNAAGNNNGKRKRSWSRAVFTNLQRKGLEIQFQQQKYITKPDRRKLAARLNLTDAQVKVWFQNRRMKWRHTRENLKSGQEKQPSAVQGGGGGFKTSTVSEDSTAHETLDYSSDSCSSADLSEQADDDDNIEINVVE
ncbi:LOW QUALITY PROTEIN: homeobox protein H2.0 [Drosophila ficusphila]|uniref:LOW QUALITY PROTEIN: homeobox protein H2.0 n=1 Tax=Drosophila ficusphila TaxID=30025 RepID=UPI0007E6F249|nr:LOW QUALITY PROTEIN: homeobox protein H2.0 [Drosophila ficusphila]